MKKLVIVFIFLTLFSQFAFSDDISVSSFIGVYIGYGHMVNHISNYNGVLYMDQKFNILLLGISTRYGISNKISDDLTLYFLGLLDLGFDINFSPEIITLAVPAILGGEVKVKYKDYFFGLGNGIGYYAPASNSIWFFLRPSFGYVIKPNLLIDVFVDLINIGISSTRENGYFRLGFTFSIFK